MEGGKDEWTGRLVLVESGMGQLQVTVAGLGRGACGRACGRGQGTWYPAPGRLGTMGHASALQHKRGWHGFAGGLQNWGKPKSTYRSLSESGWQHHV